MAREVFDSALRAEIERSYEVVFYATGPHGEEHRTRSLRTIAYDARDAVFQVRAPFEREFPGRTFHLVSVSPARRRS